MNDLISICIPTYQRPDVLAVCVNSCLYQSYRPLEIIVSDDSATDEARAVLARLPATTGVSIKYVHNSPSLGQNANVNQLFGMASGDRLVLLHDDDYFLPGGLDALVAGWNAQQSPIIVFGKQQMVSDSGALLEKATAHLNATYYRTDELIGHLPSLLACALLRQIPNNGYLISSQACRRIGYCPASEMACSCDTDFGLRLGIAYDATGAEFIGTFTTAYRVSVSAISTNTHIQSVLMPIDKSRLFEKIAELKINPQIEYARDIALLALASGAIKGFSIRSRQRDALRVYFSKHYPLRKRISLRGLYHLLIIMAPFANRLQRHRRIARMQAE